ncbi:putative amidohydrolase 3 protein [Neofusicoccum parvum UCRNP2]|uniref:Putative amidohydrolase 3 protein n=1 Tax=Botryosphaeria parva (strain UCR-NP2) TaxID=1287680 RepID=R1E801_BOTPV|nr:putative amidohydrolase 3 protein [Neofusicoccum parvum UCRNP2]
MATSLPIRRRRPDASAGVALPHDYWELYKSYKRDTNYILDWLRLNAVENVARSKKSRSPIEDRLPVRQMLRASELISKRRLAAPQYIRGAFKRTLVKRRQLNQWYRQFEHGDPQVAARNESHEYFNDALAKAHDLIFAQQDTPAVESGPATDQAPAAATAVETKPAEDVDFQPSRNFYEILADIDEKEPESPVSEPTDQELAGVPEPREYVIVDDPLAEILDLHMYVLEMDAICSATKQFWKLAAHGQLPVPLAAWLTTAGFSSLKQLSNLISPAIGGHRGLIRVYASKKAQLGIAGIDVGRHEAEKSGENPPYQEFSNGMALTYPSTVLASFKKEKQRNSDFMGVVERKPISTYFPSATEESQQHEQFMQAVEATITDPENPDLPNDQAAALLHLLSERQAKDRQAMESVLRSITQLIRNEETKGAFKKDDMNPLLHETRDFLASNEDTPDTSLVVGLQMLLETCKSFVWLENSPNPMNCRMMALRFAQEVKQNIQSVNDHDLIAKNHTVPTAAGLVGVSDRLKALLHEKRLDLYSQSPWTGGQQMVQILGYALEAGLSLCNQRGIVGTVLHGYNLVQQLTKEPTKNPLLDALSDLFLEPVFLGRLPTSNYQSIWLRFLGGGVDKKNIRGKDGKKFTITLPKRPRDSNNSADFQKRIDAFNLSLFHNLYDSNWMGGPNFWAQVFTDRKKKTASKQEMLEMDMKLHKKPFGHALEMMSGVVVSEFNSSFPIAKVNFFAVYMICVDILVEIAKRASENPPKELVWARDAGIHDTNVDAAAGFGFMALVLMDIDMRVGKGLQSKVSEHSGLRIVQDSINHVWAEKKLEDFFWKNL